jgi:hypothetical protein
MATPQKGRHIVNRMHLVSAEADVVEVAGIEPAS